MKMAAGAACLMAGVTLLAQTPAASSPEDTAFRAFWNAQTPEAAATTIDAIARLNLRFADAYARLRRGRDYSSAAPKGIVRLSHHFALGDFNYTIEVPATYTPSRRYQVRVQLHGGVTGREDGAIRGAGGIGQLAGVEQIYVMPISWQAAPWWSNAQLENIRQILDTLKRTYNVDENRVVMSGVSDGATANYYFAMRDTTPFASFLTLNGALAVLQNSSMKIDGELFPQNLMNKPFFMVNGAKDPLYPPDIVEPYIDHMKKHGVELVYHQQPNGVHNTVWWPEEKDAFEAFVRDHPRKAYPDHLTWESDMSAGTNRAHWLVIDRLASQQPPTSDAQPGDPAAMPDLNIFQPDLMGRFGLKVDGTTVVRAVGGSAASTFQFEPGDVITSVQGQPVAKDADVSAVFGQFKEGLLRVTVSRAGVDTPLAGYYKAGDAAAGPLFSHTVPSGRADLVREGNVVRVTTKNVAALTLLISPDVFDFTKPVRVIANDKTVFDGRVYQSVPALLKWAAHDNDRTMLFGAEIHVSIK
jgi:hypothetical protein